MLEPGEQIDIWVVEKALGSGGMGSVYRCHNRSATRILAAVKVLDPAVRAATGAQERFIREAEILYQLDHLNIVKVRNIRIDADMPYLEMEFVEGESLERRLRRGALPFSEALSVMAQLADAVAYMHGRGVCHRDLKPANVLIDPNGRVRVVDFGLALESDRSRLTQAGMTFGTVSYAPPEWATPEQMRPQAWDIYAMGTMFWEMLTGRMAFPMSGQGNPRQQAMQVILHKQDHPPLDPGKRYHTDLRALVGEMTHSDPAARVQDAAEVLARVRALTPSLAVESGETLTPVFAAARMARPPDTWGDVDSEAPEDPTTLPPAPPPAPAGRRTLWLLALAVPILAAGAGVGLWRLGQLAPPPPPATATTRAVIVATASPPGLPTRFLADGRAVAPDAGGSLHLDEVPVGELVLAWVAGEGCGPCPGEGCPAWCGVGNRVVPIPAGEGPLATALQVPPPAPEPVGLALPEGLPADLAVAIHVDGVAVDLPAGGPPALSLGPGRHALRVDLGACAEDDAGCWPECPAGCASWTGEVAVPYQGPVAAVRPELGLPAAAPAAPTAAGPRRAGFVTVDAFAAWLATHPEFQAEAARAAGRGDAGYLSGWSGATPPAGAAGPVVRVSGYAAAAYCAGRGGLPPADAALPRPAGAPDLEFRDRGGAVVVLDPEAGVVPTTGRDSNVLTGFRCAR